jgi:hypothetical protein
MPRRTLAELAGIALSMVAKANLDSDLTDEVLAQRILSEADPLFVEELGRALTHQRLVMWIQNERRRAKRIMLARRLRADQKTG